MCSGRHLRLRALATLPVRLENRAGGCLPLVPAVARAGVGRAEAGPRRCGRWPLRPSRPLAASAAVGGGCPCGGRARLRGRRCRAAEMRGHRVRGLWAARPPLRSAWGRACVPEGPESAWVSPGGGCARRAGRRVAGRPVGVAGVRGVGPRAAWPPRRSAAVRVRAGGCLGALGLAEARGAGRRSPRVAGRPVGVAAVRGVGRRTRRGPGRVEPRPSSAARASCCAAGSGRAARHVLRPDRPARGRRPVRGPPSTRAARRPGRGRRPAQAPPPGPVLAPQGPTRPTPRAEARLRGRRAAPEPAGPDRRRGVPEVTPRSAPRPGRGRRPARTPVPPPPAPTAAHRRRRPAPPRP